MQFEPRIPNAAYHFAVGDMILWTGIKRCGAAMYEGGIAANNIHQQVLHELYHIEPKYEQLSRFGPSIAMAVGNTAVSWSAEDGVKHGAEVMQHYFENDLALDSKFSCLDGPNATKIPISGLQDNGSGNSVPGAKRATISSRGCLVKQ